MNNYENKTKVELIAEIERLEKFNSNLKLLNDDRLLEKVAEGKTNDSKEKYKIFYEKFPLSYQSLNEDGTFKDLNPRWLKTLGYERKEVIGKNYADFLHPDWKKRFEKNFPIIKKQGFINNARFKIRHKDGHYLDISFDGYIVYNPDGSFRQTCCVFKDITEQKQVEDKLRISEEKYRSMIETSNDMIWMLDSNGNITFLNKQAEKGSGFLFNDLKNKSFEPIVMEDELPFLKEVFAKVMSGKTISYEMRLKTVFDTILTLSVNTAPILFEDKIEGMFSFAHDISLRKEFEQSLQESEKRFKALHNASFGGIAIHDIGIIKDCNQGLSDITGYTIEELIGMDSLLCFAKDSRKLVNKNILDGYEKPYEAVGLRKNGEEYPLMLTGKMIPYDGKNIRVAEFRDITKQKNAENELKKYHENLEELVKERTIDLEEKNKELERFNDLFVDREIRIKELRDKLKNLENE